MNAVTDNDVLFKVACYGLLDEIIGEHRANEDDIGVLGAARFVIPQKIRRATLQGGSESAVERLLMFIDGAEELEPTDEEQQLAADLELCAQRCAVNLDTGESQLCAVSAMRLVKSLLTGDKRAIRAIEVLLDQETRLHAIRAKVWCLEQLVASALEANDQDVIRNAVCSEPAVDKTLTICFSCSSATGAQAEAVLAGLRSYIGDLRTQATRVLAPS